MQISEIHLKAQHLTLQKEFYLRSLGLPLLEERPSSVTFQAGATRLTFHTTEQHNIMYHFALRIPRNKMAQAKKWLAARTSLLVFNGQNDFAFDSWYAQSLYFRDPAGNIAELIAHHTLPDETAGDFTFHDLLSVSEIGLVVDDVAAQVASLKKRFGLEPFTLFKRNMDTFAAIGDAHGLFIVVKTGRFWFPTNTPSVIAPLDVTIEDTQELHYRAQPYPYTIRTAALAATL